MKNIVKEILLDLLIAVCLLLALPLLACIGLILQFSFIIAVPTFLIAAIVSPRFRRYLEQPECGNLLSP
jgi:CHASE2 domain-containing sensor protein